MSENTTQQAGERTQLSAQIEERGNGFPSVGEFVPGDDGELYEIVELNTRIHTHGPGAGNTLFAEVVLADWDDVEEDDVFPALCYVP